MARTHDYANRDEDNNQLKQSKGESNNTTRGSWSNTWPLEQEPCMMTSHTLQQSEYNSCMHHAVKRPNTLQSSTLRQNLGVQKKKSMHGLTNKSVSQPVCVTGSDISVM